MFEELVSLAPNVERETYRSLLFLPFRAFCVVDLKNIDDVRCPSVVCRPVSRNHRPIIGDDASSAIIIAGYDHHTKMSGKSEHF